jgi:chemotaxis protein histidine kinase CheA
MTEKQQEEINLLKELIADTSITTEERDIYQDALNELMKSEKPKATTERKPRTSKATTERKPRATKQTADDIEKAKAEIKKRTGKTEEECEKIVEEYRSLRSKSQELKKKEVEASKSNVARINKLKDDNKVIEGTTEKTADAVIETTTKDVAEKIEKQIEVVEKKAETEAKKEVEKAMPKESATEKKKEVEKKVEEKVKKETKTIVKRVVIDTSALLTSIAESLGKFDKDSQKEFLIKLRSDIDKLLAKYSGGGMTMGATQGYNITQSNLSSSSVNPTMFGGGGGVGKEKVFEAQTDGILGIYSGSDAYSIEISKGDKFITFGNQDDNNWWYVKMLDKQSKAMLQNNTFDYNKNKLRININPNDLILTFPKGENSIYAEMKEVFSKGGGVGDEFVPDGSGYIHEPSGYTLELEFSKGDETYNGTLVEENLYVIYDNDGQMVSSDAEPLEVAKETLLDSISNEFGKGGGVAKNGYAIIQGDKLRTDKFGRVEFFNTIEKALFKMSHVPRFKSLTKEEKIKLIIPYTKEFNNGGSVAYMEDGENYEYINTFGIEQDDFIKLVDAYHNSPSYNQADRVESRMIFSKMRNKYGEEKIDEVGNYIDETHESMRSMSKGGGVYNRSWHQDHARHNKSENYEVPLNERKAQYSEGGGVYNRSWHQDHARHNKSENYEVPLNERKAHGGTIEERMRMRREM